MQMSKCHSSENGSGIDTSKRIKEKNKQETKKKTRTRIKEQHVDFGLYLCILKPFQHANIAPCCLLTGRREAERSRSRERSPKREKAG